MKRSPARDDWRWQGTTAMSPNRMNGGEIPICAVARICIPTHVFGGKHSIPVPNVAAAFLNSSFTQWAKASSLRYKIRGHRDSPAKHPSRCMEFFEAVFSSAISAFASLESFANFLVPENSQYVERKKRLGIFCVKERVTIEKESTESKLGDILPSILGFETPKGKSVWEEFKRLKDHRDRFVHFKMRDQLPEVADEHLLGACLDDSCPNYPEIAYTMIEYVSERVDRPLLWMTQFKELREQDKSSVRAGARR